jgi:hypothetical protein
MNKKLFSGESANVFPPEPSISSERSLSVQNYTGLKSSASLVPTSLLLSGNNYEIILNISKFLGAPRIPTEGTKRQADY